MATKRLVSRAFRVLSGKDRYLNIGRSTGTANRIGITALIEVSTGFLQIVVVLLWLRHAVIGGEELGFGASQWTYLTYPGLMVIGVILMIRGNWSYHEARRHASPILSSPQDVHGAFCLYLRSFEDDNRLAQAQSLPLLHTAIRFLFSIGYTEEQQLVKAISSVAPVVALGAPGELVPYAGAQRMYLPGEGWQEIVRDLMLRARLVVVVLGSGAGIRWELGQALRVLPPERLVLLVPMRRDEYEQFRRAMAAPLSAEGKRHNTARRSSVPQLPSYGGDGELTSTIQSLISFSAGWEPTARPLRRYAWYGNFLYGAISRELAVVVTRLGEDEQAPRWPLVTDSETFARAAGVVSGLAIIVSIFAGGLATVSAISVVVSGLWLVFVVLYRRRDSEAL